MLETINKKTELEGILGIDLPAIRKLPAERRADFVELLNSALDRERSMARVDLDEKLAKRSRIMRYAVGIFVLGRRR
ncbi:hypothetical protein [Nocardia sp. Marseille-Q1738]